MRNLLLILLIYQVFSRLGQKKASVKDTEIERIVDKPDDIVYDEKIAHYVFKMQKVVNCESLEIQQWNCGTACDYIDNITDIITFQDDWSGTKGYAAYDQNNHTILVVFRGTKNLQNIIQDANFIMRTYDQCQGCYIHEGFFNAYQTLRDQMMRAVKRLNKLYPNSKVIITGHSMGGAISQLAALDIQDEITPVDSVYIFASPHLGNWNYVQYYDQQIPVTFRTVFHRDVVSNTPLRWLGYYQVGIEVFYDDHQTYKVCTKKDDYSCSLKYWIRLSFEDHLHLFNERIDYCE